MSPTVRQMLKINYVSYISDKQKQNSVSLVNRSQLMNKSYRIKVIQESCINKIIM